MTGLLTSLSKEVNSRQGRSFHYHMAEMVIAILLCSGCAHQVTLYDPLPLEEVVRQIRVEHAPERKSIKLTGPWLPLATNSGHGKYLLRSFESDGTTVYQVYAVHEADYWYYLTSASDKRSGRKMEFIEIDREIISNNRALEHCAVRIDRTHLEEASRSGILISVVGRRGGITIDLPPSYIRGFLKRHDEVRKMQD